MLKLLKKMCFLGLIFTIIISAAACGKKNIDEDNNGSDDEFNPSSGLALSSEEANELNNKVRIITYFVNEDCTKLEGEIKYMDLKDAKQSIENIAGTIVTELLKGPSSGAKGKKIIPDGTKMLGPVTIAGSLAVIDLSKEFIDKSSDVKKEIEMSIYSLVNSVTEIKELDRVKILIDGKEISTFKGIVEMNVPFKRNKSLISVNQVGAKDTSADAADIDDDDDTLLE